MEFYFNESNKLFIEHNSLWFKVVAIFTDDGEANHFMAENEKTAVLTQRGNTCVIVMKNDEGEYSV